MLTPKKKPEHLLMVLRQISTQNAVDDLLNQRSQLLGKLLRAVVAWDLLAVVITTQVAVDIRTDGQAVLRVS